VSHRVLLTDNIAAAAIDVFNEYDGIEATIVGTLPADELKATLTDYDAVIVRSPTKLTADVLVGAGDRLKFIGRAGVGVDNIDTDAAAAKGITVMNAPSGNTVSTAEHAIALLMSVARRTAEGDRSLRKGRWDRKQLKGVELDGKTVGIIGIGRIGQEVARRLLAFGMKVLAADPYVSADRAVELGVELVELDRLIAESHFITVHVPLGAETRAIIGDDEIGRMRDGVFLVNCARGGIMDEDAVVRGLEAGKIAGVAFDVFSEEPPENNPLLAHPRSVFTPHLGAATAEAQVRVAIAAARNVADALSGNEIRDVVAGPSQP
jgi:D-3-phosphoglycerate dehydrogenase